jgi:nitroreductase
MYEDGKGMSALLQVQGQTSALTAPATLFIVENYTPFAQSGDDLAIRSTGIEAGHVAQNVLLMATELDLSGVPMTGFNVTNVEHALALDKNHHAIYTVAFGTAQYFFSFRSRVSFFRVGAGRLPVRAPLLSPRNLRAVPRR